MATPRTPENEFNFGFFFGLSRKASLVGGLSTCSSGSEVFGDSGGEHEHADLGERADLSTSFSSTHGKTTFLSSLLLFTSIL